MENTEPADKSELNETGQGETFGNGTSKKTGDTQNLAVTSPASKVWVFLVFIFLPLVVILSVVTYAVVVNFYGGYSGPGSGLLKKLPVMGRGIGGQGDTIRSNQNNVRRVLDGVYVESGKDNLPPVAVMIDNHPDAYPQTGLAEAQLVYEAPVEGGITRYMAVYTADTAVDRIGPVRSARPYFIDWASELSAVYSHCGGSPEALAQVTGANVLDMNEFYQGGYFWRASDRSAPHNVMTSTDNLNRFEQDHSLSAGDYFYWRFKDDLPADKRPASSSAIMIPEFGVSWEYDPAGNTYQRFLNGRPHLDALGLPIVAKNVAVEYTDMEVIDEKLRLKLRTIGTGPAIICEDGSCQEGSWQKNSASSRTRFLDGNQSEVAFNAGTTWIEVVEMGYNISY